MIAGLLGVFLATAPVTHAAAPTGAQGAPVASGSAPLDVTILVETLVVEAAPGGQDLRRWEPAGRLSAGDEVHYTIRVRNPGKEPVNDVVVTKRLPFGVQYLRGSAVGPACDIQFSADGGRTFFVPAKSTASTSGKPAARKIQTTDYSHVRWILAKPLAPGATALLRFRAIFS